MLMLPGKITRASQLHITGIVLLLASEEKMIVKIFEI